MKVKDPKGEWRDKFDSSGHHWRGSGGDGEDEVVLPGALEISLSQFLRYCGHRA